MNSGLPRKHQLAVRRGFEPMSPSTEFKGRRSNHSATLPPIWVSIIFWILRLYRTYVHSLNLSWWQVWVDDDRMITKHMQPVLFPWSANGLSFSVQFWHLDYFLSVAELAIWWLNPNESNKKNIGWGSSDIRNNQSQSVISRRLRLITFTKTANSIIPDINQTDINCSWKSCNARATYKLFSDLLGD